MANYQTPRGTQDIYGEDVRKWQAVEDLIRTLCNLYNYEEIRTPEFEHTEVYKRENDSSDMVNKEMYTFLDNGERSLTLRPEGTAGAIRAYVEHKMFADPDLPKKFFYLSPCFRYERPQKGRMRIHHQFGTEVIGLKNPLIDAEVICLGYSVLRALGLNDIKVLINTLGDEETRNNYREALKKHFEKYLPDMCEDCQRRFIQNPLRILDCKVDADSEALKTVPNIQDYLSENSKKYFEEVLSCLENLGIPYELSSKLVRGLDYYTDTVFEVVSCNKEMGSQSTIFGGGRYDKLVEYFGGPEQSGMGFGMGLERIMVALEAEGLDVLEPRSLDLYFMPLKPEYEKQALLLATIARSNGYTCEIDYQGRSMKSLFKAADRYNTKVLAIIGEDEMANNEVTLKRVLTKEQVTISIYEMIGQLDQWLAEENDDEECGCGHHEHKCECEDGKCECGHHEHECECEDGECGCGHHHEQKCECEDGECGCGHHHEQKCECEDGKCECGHHEQKCECGHHHN